MGKYNFDEIVERRHTNSLKYDECQNPYLPEHFIPMWVADMDFACPQPILDAMKARIDKRILAYLLQPAQGVHRRCLRLAEAPPQHRLRSREYLHLQRGR